MEEWLEDHQSDWLAEELRLEGYSVKTSPAAQLKAEHEAMEQGSGHSWNSGAQAVKRLHAQLHAQLHAENRFARKPLSATERMQRIFIFAILFSIGCILGMLGFFAFAQP